MLYLWSTKWFVVLSKTMESLSQVSRHSDRGTEREYSECNSELSTASANFISPIYLLMVHRRLGGMQHS
jgi:hypothetical protein